MLSKTQWHDTLLGTPINMTKTEQLVIRLSRHQKEALRLLSESAGVSMANYIITKLKLDKKAT